MSNFPLHPDQSSVGSLVSGVVMLAGVAFIPITILLLLFGVASMLPHW